MANLGKSLKDLVQPGEEISVTDANLPISLRIKLEYPK